VLARLATNEGGDTYDVVDDRGQEGSTLGSLGEQAAQIPDGQEVVQGLRNVGCVLGCGGALGAREGVLSAPCRFHHSSWTLERTVVVRVGVIPALNTVV
jgi:hypothetical protein